MRGVWLRGRMECAFNGSVTGQCKQAGDPLPRGGTTMRVPTETPTKRAESQEIERVYGPAQPPHHRSSAHTRSFQRPIGHADSGAVTRGGNLRQPSTRSYKGDPWDGGAGNASRPPLI